LSSRIIGSSPFIADEPLGRSDYQFDGYRHITRRLEWGCQFSAQDLRKIEQITLFVEVGWALPTLVYCGADAENHKRFLKKWMPATSFEVIFQTDALN
jgi:hypothetical protein